AHTTQSVTEVLDRYEGYCRSAPSALGRAMQEIPQALEGAAPVSKEQPALAGILREEAGGRGMVACFVDEHASGDLERLGARLQAFSRSGDLSELGRFRYAFAERAARGGTRVVT